MLLVWNAPSLAPPLRYPKTQTGRNTRNPHILRCTSRMVVPLLSRDRRCRGHHATDGLVIKQPGILQGYANPSFNRSMNCERSAASRGCTQKVSACHDDTQRLLALPGRSCYRRGAIAVSRTSPVTPARRIAKVEGIARASLEDLDIPHLEAPLPGPSVVSLRHISHILPTVYKPPQERGMASSSQGSIFFATGNKNKIREVVAILEAGHPLPFTIQAADLDLPELQGEPEDIAREKCRLAAQQVGGAVIVEDTCLCFEAYNGLPGAYVKWFLAKIGLDGLNKMLAGFDDKRAYALCSFAFTPGPNADPIVFVGRTDGVIVPARGAAQFGWDPIFQPEGFRETYAEMDKKVKNSISHRYRALEKLISHLRSVSSIIPIP